MGIAGTNLSRPDQTKAFQMIAKFMGLNVEGTCVIGRRSNTRNTDTTRPRNIAFLVKTAAGAPTTNTAADAPTGLGDFCIHQTSAYAIQAIYVCTAFTSTSSFTWTSISAV
jgi:hypothetical protein